MFWYAVECPLQDTITLHVQDGEVSRHRVNIPPPSMRPKSQRN
jgi:hypothetical protein